MTRQRSNLMDSCLNEYPAEFLPEREYEKQFDGKREKERERDNG